MEQQDKIENAVKELRKIGPESSIQDIERIVGNVFYDEDLKRLVLPGNEKTGEPGTDIYAEVRAAMKRSGQEDALKREVRVANWKKNYGNLSWLKKNFIAPGDVRMARKFKNMDINDPELQNIFSKEKLYRYLLGE